MGFMHLRADTHQTQTLSPRLQRAVQLLQMSSQDFAAMVRDKIGDNPFLEGEDEMQEAPSLSAQEEGLPRADEAWEPSPAQTVADEPPGDRDLWMAHRAGVPRQGGEGQASAIDLAESETTLAMHLHGQLNVMPLPPRDLLLARAIVESLDDDGYLRSSLDEIAALLPLKPLPDSDEMRIALCRVQALEPTGVAARGVGECLLLQCPGIADADLRALAQRLLADHLPALATRDMARLTQALGRPASAIAAALDCIRHLDPHPGWRIGSTRVDYVVPDIIVRRSRDSWDAQLNPVVVPRVRLNKVYEQLFQRHRRSEHAQMSDQLQDARWTLRNVEQRFATILEVAQAIIRKQRLFLEYGAMAMKPLVLREIADEVGVHESTVSRVTNNKYMATPLGVFELKYFFSRPLRSASGKPCSPTAIRELIGDIIAAESPSQPLSDAAIMRQLAAQGLVITRRTVTKYRQLLHIEPLERRRSHV